jgi:hypothetical protein
MKKTLAILLALAICLALVPMTALAANDYLELDKANYLSGETITVTTKNITAQMETDEAFVGIYEAGAAHDEWGEYHYPQAGTDTLNFTARENGSYEMRLYRADHLSDYGPAFVTSVPFTVGGSSSGNPGTEQEPDDTTMRYPTKDEFDWGLVDFTPGNHSWTGTYETNWQTLSLLQNGNKITGQYPEWDNGKIEGDVIDGILYGYWLEAPSYKPPSDAGQIVFVMQEDGKGFTGWWRYGNSGSWGLWSTGARNEQETSDWASGEIAKADALGLIPDSLQSADLTKPITRAEFAAVSVKVYENLSGTAAIPAVNNPFTDTRDAEVLKAYNVGITTGTGATTFDPAVLLNREQAATMLTRVFKKVSLAGWTMQTDAEFTLEYTKPAAFADDAKISDWAKDSVYFMAANGIINGTGSGNFSPRATTTEEQAQNYASATREQALAIAVRMVENLK